MEVFVGFLGGVFVGFMIFLAVYQSEQRSKCEAKNGTLVGSRCLKGELINIGE